VKSPVACIGTRVKKRQVDGKREKLVPSNQTEIDLLNPPNIGLPGCREICAQFTRKSREGNNTLHSPEMPSVGGEKRAVNPPKKEREA